MNCQKGDLAVMIRSAAGNEGRIVTCLRLASEKEVKETSFRSNLEPVWIIDSSLRSSCGRSMSMAIDAWLRPIRDQPGEDETLTWAGFPTTHKETV